MATTRIAPEALEELKHATINGNAVTLRPNLERSLYLKVAEALKILGGKWNRAQQATMFPNDPGGLIADAIATGEVFDEKKAYQFYETPEAVVTMIMALAEIGPKHSVLEPSAGGGRIVREVLRVAPWCRYCEIQSEKADALKKLEGALFLNRDFLMLDEKDHKFDRIVMNPPFTRGQDVDHVTKAWAHLKPGGIMVAVTAPGWTFRQDSKFARFRSWLETEPTEVVKRDLPRDTFSESGTGVATILLKIAKGTK